MTDDAKNHFLSMIYKFWVTSYYPSEWREAIMIPISKPGKDHSRAINYRPIALTSCLGKTIERMINKVQCGCQRGMSTTDHLVRIETEIRRACVLNEHFVSIFYDLEKAYDTTWRYGPSRYRIKGSYATVH